MLRAPIRAQMDDYKATCALQAKKFVRECVVVTQAGERIVVPANHYLVENRVENEDHGVPLRIDVVSAELFERVFEPAGPRKPSKTVTTPKPAKKKAAKKAPAKKKTKKKASGRKKAKKR